MPDIIIVGGGPAGLLTAGRCAEAGLEPLLLEEHARIGEPTHCTGIISPEATRYAKVPDEIVLSRLTRARLVSPNGAVWEVPWDGAPSEEILAIDRLAFDRELARYAVGAGAAVETGARVDRVRVASGGVEVSAGARVLRAPVCVLACGVSYGLQRQLGFDLPRQLLHAAQVEVEVDAEPSGTVELHFGRDTAPSGFLWTVPVTRDGRHRLKIGVLAQGNAGGYLEMFLGRPSLQRRLRAEPDVVARRVVPVESIRKTYADRVIVVGDAAGFTKPTTGGGIFYSLVTASLAAETLVEAFQARRFDGEFLARYERRWQSELGQELRVASWFRHLLVKCTDAEIDTLIQTVAAGDAGSLIRRIARFNWHQDLIRALAHHPEIGSLLLRLMFR